MKGALFAAAVVLIPAAASAQMPLTGMELYNLCVSKFSEIETYCHSYLAGITEGLVLGQQLMQYGAVICLPTGITPPQTQLMVQNAAREHPELLNQPAVTIVAKAVVDAYRCRPGQKPVYGQRPN
jgi:hypothetical protein